MKKASGKADQADARPEYTRGFFRMELPCENMWNHVNVIDSSIVG
jgi:hypothetical protein